ncbi:MAG: ribonuclease Y [Faecalibacterium sp.]
MDIIITVIVAIVAAVLSGGAFFVVGTEYRKKIAEAKIGSAETEAKRIVNDAIKTAEQKRKETILEAKDEAFKLKSEIDQEVKERRAEVSRQENRIDQKETALDKKVEAFEKKEEALKVRAEELEARLVEVEALRVEEEHKLEEMANLSEEEAKKLLLAKVDEDLAHDKAQRIATFEINMKDECDTIARNLVGQAISRCAADHSSETTVSVVTLPSDEMKGRIIGREGRNIRALETATGVDLIIDDTPEAITLSSFDQTRREVARLTLEKLIGDGRIHPARIEETVEKCRHDLEMQMKREGERVVMELGIHSLHPDLVKLIGRLKFRTSFGQNALNHSMEVAWISGLMASELGVNVTLARRAGLLHDIGKALDHEIEGSHVQIGVDICRKYKENAQLIHAVEAHHGDVEPKTPLAFIVQAADAISAARPGARRENLESYIKRLENLEEISSSFNGVEQAFAVQAGREVRILVKPEIVGDDQVVILARSIAKKIEDTLDYPGQIKVNVIRESRATEYAK